MQHKLEIFPFPAPAPSTELHNSFRSHLSIELMTNVTVQWQNLTRLRIASSPIKLEEGEWWDIVEVLGHQFPVIVPDPTWYSGGDRTRKYSSPFLIAVHPAIKVGPHGRNI